MKTPLSHLTAIHFTIVLCSFLFVIPQSQAQWTTPVNASIASDNADNARLAFSADGTRAVAVWRLGNGGQFLIQGATGRVSGSSITWETPVDLSAFGSVNRRPTVAISADGLSAIALWSSDAMSSNTLESRTALIGSSTTTWSSPVTIASDGFPDFSEVRISSNGSSASAIWLGYDGSNFVARTASASISANTAAWGSVTDRSAAGASADSPKIEISADGSRATAMWQIPKSGSDTIQSASAIISGNSEDWSSATDLSLSGGDASLPNFKMSSDGTKASAVWLRADGSSNTIVQTKSATISGKNATWGSSTDLSLSGQNSSYPAIGLSADGASATALWSRSDGSAAIAQSRSASITGNTASWDATVTDLSASGESATHNKIALSADGARAVAVWLRSNGSNNIVQGATASIDSASASWAAAADISASGRDAENPLVESSAAGTNSIAFWSRFSGSFIFTQSALNGLPPTPTPAPTATLTPTPAPSATPTATPTITPTSAPTRPSSICVYGDSSAAAKPYLGTYQESSTGIFNEYLRSGASYPYHITFFSISSGFAKGPGTLEFKKSGGIPVGIYTRNGPELLYVAAGDCSATPPPAPTPTNYIGGSINCSINTGCPGVTAALRNVSDSEAQKAALSATQTDEPIQTVLVSSDGSYRFDDLQPGTYSIQFSSDGLSFEQSTITVTLEDYGIVTVPDIDTTIVSYNDSGCKVKNMAKIKVAALSSARGLQKAVVDQVVYGSFRATQKLSESKSTKYINALSKLETSAKQAYRKINVLTAKLPDATRLDCPKSNQCQARNYSKTIQAYVKELTKLNKILNTIVTNSNKTFPEKQNLNVSKKSLLTIKKLYKKSLDDAKKLPVASQLCPVST